MSWLPIVAQVKSAVQAIGGNPEAARQTQVDFLRQCPGVSLGTSAYYLVQGKTSEAGAVQAETGSLLWGMVEGFPVAGHVVAGVHYAVGNKAKGEQVMRAATRTTAAAAGGLVGALAGPAGAVAGGITAATAVDGVITSVDSDESKYRPYGTLQLVNKLVEGSDDNAGTGFDLVLGVVADGLTGHMGGQIADYLSPGEPVSASTPGTGTGVVAEIPSAAGPAVAEASGAAPAPGRATPGPGTAQQAASKALGKGAKMSKAGAKAAKQASKAGKQASNALKQGSKQLSKQASKLSKGGAKAAQRGSNLAKHGSKVARQGVKVLEQSSAKAANTASVLETCSTLAEKGKQQVIRPKPTPKRTPKPPPIPPMPKPKAVIKPPAEEGRLPEPNRVFPEPRRLCDLRGKQEVCNDKPVVVMIHGLDGHPISTWLPSGSTTDRTAVWSMLESDNVFPSSTRLLAAGHFLGLWDTDATLDREAKQVHGRLRTAGVTAARSIFWIVHSMGGLVVKELLLRYPRLRSRTSGVVFYATPHAGSYLASLSQGVAVRCGNKEWPLEDSSALRAMDPMRLNSMTHLHKLSCKFVSYNIPHVSLCETKPVSPSFLGIGLHVQVVKQDSGLSMHRLLSAEQQSARIGDVPRYHAVTVDRNHGDIKLHASSVDPVYQAVRRHIVAMVHHFRVG